MEKGCCFQHSDLIITQSVSAYAVHRHDGMRKQIKTMIFVVLVIVLHRPDIRCNGAECFKYGGIPDLFRQIVFDD